MKPPAVGGMIALAVVLIDQIVKVGVLTHFDSSGVDPSSLGPFLNLTLQMNRGISFSLFARDSVLAQVALLALTLAVVGLLVWWLFRSRSVLPAAGLGLIIGGALGNAVDRLAHGAVVDYLDLHALGRHFFVFNIADAAINVGVALLILDLLLVPSAPKSQSQGSPPRSAG
jgi:signal peptidase II